MYCSSKNASITFSGFRVLGFIGFQHPKTVIPKTIKKTSFTESILCSKHTFSLKHIKVRIFDIKYCTVSQ
jgi:hypothetical protein